MDRAKSQARIAVRRLPTWSSPEGLGAKRPADVMPPAYAQQHKSPSATDDFGKTDVGGSGALAVPGPGRCSGPWHCESGELLLRHFVQKDDGVNKSQSAGGFLAGSLIQGPGGVPGYL
ncbi:hypothetical protein NicSoilB4_34890 [Arthrobacter sp. NicSoilB4]|nr:hypothetical protein NicSoilB4_34890 [Arthrobacter sp. NicSoilB4]